MSFFDFFRRKKKADETASSAVESSPTESAPAETAARRTLTTEEKVTVKNVVINQATNVRAEDNNSSEMLTTLAKGDEVELVSESKKRYEVKYSGSKKYK